MQQSHVIEVDGIFVGAAVRLGDGVRFVAVDVRVKDLDDTIFPSLNQAHEVARKLYRIGRSTTPRKAVTPYLPPIERHP